VSAKRDYAYEALARVTNSDQNAARGELNAALKSIREQSEIEDSYFLADEIHERAKMYRAVMGDALLTPTALAKHWLRVFEESKRLRATGVNRSAESRDPVGSQIPSSKAPEWYWVWVWCRWIRNPRDFRSFPQQSQYVDPTSCMTQAQYEELHAEWIEKGSPRTGGPVPAAR